MGANPRARREEVPAGGLRTVLHGRRLAPPRLPASRVVAMKPPRRNSSSPSGSRHRCSSRSRGGSSGTPKTGGRRRPRHQGEMVDGSGGTCGARGGRRRRSSAPSLTRACAVLHPDSQILSAPRNKPLPAAAARRCGRRVSAGRTGGDFASGADDGPRARRRAAGGWRPWGCGDGWQGDGSGRVFGRRGQGAGSSLVAKLLHRRDGGGVGAPRRCQAVEGRLRSVVVSGEAGAVADLADGFHGRLKQGHHEAELVAVEVVEGSERLGRVVPVPAQERADVRPLFCSMWALSSFVWGQPRVTWTARASPYRKRWAWMNSEPLSESAPRSAQGRAWRSSSKAGRTAVWLLPMTSWLSLHPVWRAVRFSVWRKPPSAESPE